MQKGEVKERGTHDELVAMNGVYKNLVNRQLVTEAIKKEDDAYDVVKMDGQEFVVKVEN